MPPYDPLSPRTNQSVAAFAAAIRDQLAAIIAANGVTFSSAGQYVYTTSAATPTLRALTSHASGHAGLEFGVNTTADSFVGIERAANLFRFNSGPRPAAFFYGGSEVMRYTSGLNLAIGTTSANARLDVFSPSSSNFTAVLRNGGGAHTGLAFSSSTTPLADTQAWGLVGGASSALTGAANAAAVVLGSGVTDFRVTRTAGNLSQAVQSVLFGINGADGRVMVGAYSDARLSVYGGSYNTSIHAWGPNNEGVGLTLECTATGSRKYSIVSTGPWNTPGEGCLGIFDQSVGWRQWLNANGVTFMANATAAPAANPNGGFFLYGEGGAAKVRGGSGTVTTFGPADPHCPACDADFATEQFNPAFGYVSICLFCLAADLGDKPYIVRHQNPEHAAAVAARDAATVAAAKTARLAEAASCCDVTEPVTLEPTGALDVF